MAATPKPIRKLAKKHAKHAESIKETSKRYKKAGKLFPAATRKGKLYNIPHDVPVSQRPIGVYSRKAIKKGAK